MQMIFLFHYLTSYDSICLLSPEPFEASKAAVAPLMVKLWCGCCLGSSCRYLSDSATMAFTWSDIILGPLPCLLPGGGLLRIPFRGAGLLFSVVPGLVLLILLFKLFEGWRLLLLKVDRCLTGVPQGPPILEGVG